MFKMLSHQLLGTASEASSSSRAEPSTSSRPGPGGRTKRQKKPYASACVLCRTRKISCQGGRPSCQQCLETSDECYYKEPARTLRRKIPRSSTPVEDAEPGSSREWSHLQERIRKLESIIQRVVPEGSDGTSAETTLPAHLTIVDQPVSPGVLFKGARYRLKLDDAGNVRATYHGLTSLARGETLPDDNRATSMPQQSLSVFPCTDTVSTPFFQMLAASRHTLVSPELGDALLASHFCYSSQVFCVVSKSLFLRDMALDGPWFSPFLLMCIYASGTRMLRGLDARDRQAQGDMFMRVAREHLLKELEGPSKITTIQGLLLMSGRDHAVGHVAQGWVEAGLAFRLLQDMGIHLPPDQVLGFSRFSQEEQNVRAKLFWSAFTWDKMISLSMGREPTFPPRSGLSPDDIPVFENDESVWEPYFQSPADCPPQLAGYGFRPSSVVVVFRAFARLSLMLHEIVVRLYMAPPGQVHHVFVAETCRRLDDWWSHLPKNLQITGGVCPPPYVFSVLMMYHTTNILLCSEAFRPPTPLSTEVDDRGAKHAALAFDLAVAYNDTFATGMSYMGMYSAFVAGNFEISQLHSQAPSTRRDALSRLRSWLDILDRNALQGPAISASIQSIADTVYDVIKDDQSLSTSSDGQSIRSRHLDGSPQGYDYASFFDFNALINFSNSVPTLA